MTVPKRLVFEGSRIKVRCEERRVEVGSVCVPDQVRFTVDRVHVRVAPLEPINSTSIWDEGYRLRKFKEVLDELRAKSSDEAQALEQANFLANEVAAALGEQFKVGEITKGHDFYKHRIPLLLNEQEVASVMCWSSSNSPRQQGQRDTINVYIHGVACTFAVPGWEKRVHAIGASKGARLTAIHLAVDFFDGLPGGLEGVYQEYRNGFWDHLGKRPNVDDVGWLKGHSRSLYFGSKEAGKQTNWYEKGDQLFGHEEAAQRGVKWLRCELRFGNKLRYLDWDMLLRPADFFAGASAAHESYLLMAQRLVGCDEVAQAQNLPCNRRDAPMAIEAECARVVRWMRSTAGAAFSTLIRYMKQEQLVSILDEGGIPRRLRKFSSIQIASAFQALDVPDLCANDSINQRQSAQLLAAA
jgi:phage replication initiation protein